MQIFEPMLFGAVQGLAEFLPISSSGHLLLLHSVTHFSAGSDLSFDVALHMGTLVALIVYFWRDIVQIFGSWLRGFGRWQWSNPQQRLGWLLILASVPGAAAGALLESKADTIFRAPALTAVALIIAGVGLWLADRYAAQTTTMDSMRWPQAISIGIGQALALVPGVSRSGATIALGRALKMTREAAARFSFLMSAPILAGAGAKKFLELRHETLTGHQQADFIIGMITAAVVGYIAIRVLLRYISRHSYSIFMWYRVALGLGVFVALWIAR